MVTKTSRNFLIKTTNFQTVTYFFICFNVVLYHTVYKPGVYSIALDVYDIDNTKGIGMNMFLIMYQSF